MMAAKARFIAPATVFFVVYYFALPILVGHATELGGTREYWIESREGESRDRSSEEIQ